MRPLRAMAQLPRPVPVVAAGGLLEDRISCSANGALSLLGLAQARINLHTFEAAN
jgi:hypothetical protein